jgi:hypothetical protein
MDTSKFIPSIKLSVSRLPSGGKTYPKNVQISYRGYLFGELQEINGSKGRPLLDTMKDAMSGVTTLGMDTTALTLPDAVYLGILRRMSTTGASEFEIKYVCRNDKCRELNTHTFSQQNISFNDLAIDGVGVKIELTNGKTYELSPLTFGDFIRLANGIPGSKVKGELIKNKTATLAIMCRNMPFDEVYNDFYTITHPEDIEAIREVNELLHHDLKPLDAICKKCGHANKVVLEGRDSLITPFRGGGSSDRKRVHIIKRTEPQSLSHEDDGV